MEEERTTLSDNEILSGGTMALEADVDGQDEAGGDTDSDGTDSDESGADSDGTDSS